MKEFIWTDKTIVELLTKVTAYRPETGYWEREIEAFKTSKQPKPEWEILKVINKRNESVHTPEPTCMTNGICSIYSVKRLSDGEVFTVGDLFVVPENEGMTYVIKSFYVPDFPKNMGVIGGPHSDPKIRWAGWLKAIARPVTKPDSLESLQASFDGKMAIWMTQTQVEKLKKFLNTL